MTRLPADEISMAQLQGHFLEFSHSPELCIENIPKLLNSSKPKKKTELSTYEHLRRVGLESYAAAIEFTGVYTEKDFPSISIKQVLKNCPNLQLDIEAVDRLTKLISKDETFMANNYTLAEISLIRESFLVAYPTLHEVEHGERDVIFRSSSKTSVKSNGDMLIDEYDVDIEEFLNNFSKKGDSNFRMYEKTNSVSSVILDKLSREFTHSLTTGGKSIVSIYQLNKLLEAYPDRPIQCVIASRTFIQERSSDSFLSHDMTTFTFLKRLGCIKDIHSIEAKAKTIRDLYHLLDKDKGELKIPNISECIQELLTIKEKDSYPIELLSFQLVSKKRIIWEFVSFYQKVKNDSDDKADQKMPTSISTKLATLHLSQPDLEEQAFTFSSLLSDSSGVGSVSLTELLEYFTQPEHNSPSKALANISKLLTDPPRPPEPEPSPPEPETEWVYEWLATVFPEDKGLVSKYGRSFIEQGISSREDLVFGALFNEQWLKDLGINKVGHIRKIIFMHSRLVNN